MNALVVEKFAFQVADTTAIAAHFAATRNYKRMYREGAERHAETIELAIKGLVALYGWVMLHFSPPEPMQPILTGTEVIAVLPPAAEEPQRVLVTSAPVSESDRVLVTPAPAVEQLEAIDDLLAIEPTPHPIDWNLAIRQLKALASLESVKGYCNMPKTRLVEALTT
ncbi:hypothetical protein NDA01_25935 [Trichocoleus desertorum AS-A10]|uniref:hypothetical protein n=1 Tax=Trichocoleus desertorum TaxID=1481672 RepID=UPI0032999E17